MGSDLAYSSQVAVADAQREEFLAFAVEAAEQAGAAALPFFRAQGAVDNKLGAAGFDPVTQGDRAVENELRGLLQTRYPEHGLLGEEFGAASGNGLTWVIDPIDGTRAFMSGMLHWGLLLGLFDGQRPIVGVMRQPFTEETFFGNGQVSHYQRHGVGRKRISTSGCESLQAAVLAATGPALYASQQEQSQFLSLQNNAKLTRLGCDCYAYAMLAMGSVDVAADPGLQPYDIQGLIPIIEGAGGVVTTWAGGDASMGGAIVASATAALHEQVLSRLDQAK